MKTIDLATQGSVLGVGDHTSLAAYAGG